MKAYTYITKTRFLLRQIDRYGAKKGELSNVEVFLGGVETNLLTWKKIFSVEKYAVFQKSDILV